MTLLVIMPSGIILGVTCFIVMLSIVMLNVIILSGSHLDWTKLPGAAAVPVLDLNPWPTQH
jgi:hypothetical protein